MTLHKPSTTKMKRKRESGSPCRIPEDGEKVDKGDPLTSIEKKLEYVRDIIQLT
jgi:hypothetical protein